jgi:hypothetical protein
MSKCRVLSHFDASSLNEYSVVLSAAVVYISFQKSLGFQSHVVWKRRGTTKLQRLEWNGAILNFTHRTGAGQWDSCGITSILNLTDILAA